MNFRNKSRHRQFFSPQYRKDRANLEQKLNKKDFSNIFNFQQKNNQQKAFPYSHQSFHHKRSSPINFLLLNQEDKDKNVNIFQGFHPTIKTQLNDNKISRSYQGSLEKQKNPLLRKKTTEEAKNYLTNNIEYKKNNFISKNQDEKKSNKKIPQFLSKINKIDLQASAPLTSNSIFLKPTTYINKSPRSECNKNERKESLTKSCSNYKQKSKKCPAFIKNRVKSKESSLNSSRSQEFILSNKNQFQIKHIKNDIINEVPESPNSPSPNSPSPCQSSAFVINVKSASKKWNISKFNLLKTIGKGSFGSAYIAVQIQSGFICVLKALSKTAIENTKTEQHILKQIKIQSFLEHRYITSLYGVFDDEENIYLILELLPDGNLKEASMKITFGEMEISKMVSQICEALDTMHDSNIIHRDIKPENIFIFNENVKLGDFGCSTAFEENNRRTTMIGSPIYLSPQQLRSEEYDQKIDAWGIGTLIYQLITNKCPFEKDIAKILRKSKEPILSDLAFPSYIEISDDAKDIISKLLMKQSEARLSIKDALKHKFFKKYNANSQQQKVQYFI